MRRGLSSLLLVATGLFGPAAPAVQAQGIIVTTLPEPIGMSSDLFSILYPIDVDGDGVYDFTFGADPGFIGLRTERANQVIVSLSPPPNIGGPVADLPNAFLVESSLDPQLAWSSSDPVGGYVDPGEIAFATIVHCLDTGCLSTWPDGAPTRGYIGIEFELDDGWHYGYFDLVLSGDAPGAALFGWAYQTQPGVPIAVAAVPEPSICGLLVVGIGVILRRHFRRLL